MSDELTPPTTLEGLRKQAKRWHKALLAGDPSALARLRRAYPAATSAPVLRDVQHALALEHGVPNWKALKASLVRVSASRAQLSRDDALRLLLGGARRGDAGAVRTVLDAYPEIIDERGLLPGMSGMRTALHCAMEQPSEEVVTVLLERGANPNIRCEGDWAFPLHFAVEKGHISIVKRLIEHGADPVGDNDYHELEVMGWATCFEYVKPNRELVGYLLAHGSRHTIFSAVATGNVEAIRHIVEQSPTSLEKRMDLTNHRRWPLHLAVVKKQASALATLLDLGADTTTLDESGLVALDQAALSGQLEMVDLLLNRGAELSLPTAIVLERVKDIERLMRKDPDGLKTGHRWGTLIIRASEYSGARVIETLIRLGASVDAWDDPKTAVDGAPRFTALHAAATTGNLEAAVVLLKHGANPAAREGRYCGTPAGWANYFGHAQVRDLILEGPIDLFDAIDFDLAARIPEVLARDPHAIGRPFGVVVTGAPRSDQWWPEPWCTPLMWAATRGKLEIARALIAYGADTTPRAPDGRTVSDLARPDTREEITAILNANSTREGERTDS
jgi:ankyrin repeat protein